MNTLKEWHTIDINQSLITVYKLQCEISKAWKDGDLGKVRRLQQQLVESFAARVLAVKKVMENKGAKTPGVDGEVWEKKEQWLAVVHRLKDLKDYQAQPVRRVMIPKSNGKMRPLGIPTLFDRCVQALFKLALEPIAETTADQRSYAYRPYRSVADAMKYLKLVLGSKTCRKRWVLEGDIRKFFDTISHEWLSKNIPMNRRMLTQFIKAGFIEDGTFQATAEGTPQGGVLSPVLANMVLDGLEAVMEKHNFLIVRYADDFVVLGETQEQLKRVATPLVEEFLKQRGVTLNQQKTRTVNIQEGFNFLGYRFKEYSSVTRARGTKKGTFLVMPEPAKVTELYRRAATVVKEGRHKPMYVMLTKLNQLLRGWAEHYRTASSKKVFSKVGNHIFWLVWHMLRWKHPTWGQKALKAKYYKPVKGNRWTLWCEDSNKQPMTLFAIASVKIKRHNLIKTGVNPFDPADEEYFQKRLGREAALSVLLNKRKTVLLKRQSGICPVCEQSLINKVEVEVHHILPKKLGGSDAPTNLLLLHQSCHGQVTRSKSASLRAVWLNKGILRKK